jgi:flavin reductase (DIM6/NTAB) family NADH-FMN oxidoreductase RutF
METIARPPSGRTGVDDVGVGLRSFMQAYFTGVTIVTSVDRDGAPHGLTCTSLTSVTLSPPTLLVCLDVRSGTLAALRECGGFAVNVLHDRGRPTAELFASPAPDRFSQVEWQPSPQAQLPWLIHDAFAMTECEVVQTTVVGDHAVVFGRVLTAERWPGAPLLYGMQTFAGGGGS